MKLFFVAGLVGLLFTLPPVHSWGQGTTLGSRMPSAAVDHIVRYQYVYTKLGASDSDYSGYVDMAINPDTLYYREYRNEKTYREVLYNRNAHQVLLFNHSQNRLNIFSELPYDAVPFIPFPFQDEALARLVKLAPVQKIAMAEKAKMVVLPGTLKESLQSVPVKFQATWIPTSPEPKVSTFSVLAPHGNVAGWTFTYAGKPGERTLPTKITRVFSLPIMTEEGKKQLLQHKAVPPTSWKPDAKVLYTFVSDHPTQAGEVPTTESLFRSANEQTTVADRRDLKNPISFLYQKEGGDLEGQIQEARKQGVSPNTPNTFAKLWAIGGYFLLIPPVGCVAWGVWSVQRRSARSAKTE